jgi:AraC-like DNA-binding protein
LFGSFQLLADSHALSARLTEICQENNATKILLRLSFFQAFVELLTPHLLKAMPRTESPEDDPKTRLQQFLNRVPESELADLTIGGLAVHLGCGERHASRLFREVHGASFRSCVSDIRLNKACHLLSQGDLKIIDVALDSGYTSLALFNHAFKKRFGITPSEWRKREVARARQSLRPRGGAARPLSVLM